MVSRALKLSALIFHVWLDTKLFCPVSCFLSLSRCLSFPFCPSLSLVHPSGVDQLISWLVLQWTIIFRSGDSGTLKTLSSRHAEEQMKKGAHVSHHLNEINLTIPERLPLLTRHAVTTYLLLHSHQTTQQTHSSWPVTSNIHSIIQFSDCHG